MIHSYQGHKYRDRTHAGEVLAAGLQSYRSEELVVLAVPNGGVPVGVVIARELGAELYLMLVRKLQIPDNPEAGFGALVSAVREGMNEALLGFIFRVSAYEGDWTDFLAPQGEVGPAN